MTIEHVRGEVTGSLPRSEQWRPRHPKKRARQSESPREPDGAKLWPENPRNLRGKRHRRRQETAKGFPKARKSTSKGRKKSSGGERESKAAQSRNQEKTAR